MVFGKKKEDDKAPLGADVPVQAVLSMRERKIGNEQIIEQLKSQGYSLQAIRDALTQADVKASAVSPSPVPQMPDLPPMPNDVPEEKFIDSPVRAGPQLNVAPSFAPRESKQELKIDEMERILEEIVDERWKEVTKKFNEFEAGKIKVETKVDELSKRVSELTKRLDDINSVMMSKVEDYRKTMEDVDVEIKALEKVMQKLVPSMAEQVKELRDVVGSIKGNRPLE